MANDPIQTAVSKLKAGGIIAYPTEAVYGLGCDPNNEKAVMHLLALKNRNIEKGLILIAASIKQLQPFIKDLDPHTCQRIAPTWPGPITWLLPAKDNAPVFLRGRHKKIAVRVTDHPLVIELCKKWDGALVSTSANPGDQPPARSVEQVKNYFGDKVDYILTGDLGNLSNPTEIRDAETGETIRSA